MAPTNAVWQAIRRTAVMLALGAVCSTAQASYNQFRFDEGFVLAVACSLASIAIALVAFVVEGIGRWFGLRGARQATLTVAIILVLSTALCIALSTGPAFKPMWRGVMIVLMLAAGVSAMAVSRLIDLLGWYGVLAVVLAVASTIGSIIAVQGLFYIRNAASVLVPMALLWLSCVAVLVWPRRRHRAVPPGSATSA